MATPQYATAVVKFRNGSTLPYRIYCSDAAGSVTWPDGASAQTFPQDVKITDLVFAATLATTPTLTIYVGGQPYTILNTATLAMTSINRILEKAPIYVPRGAAINIVQS